MKPTDAQMTDLIWARYQILLGSKYTEWPSMGPEKWLTKWQRLMVECEVWCPALYNNWARDFNLVWGEVPGAKRLCNRLTETLGDGELAEWDIYKATRELRLDWPDRIVGLGPDRTGLILVRSGPKVKDRTVKQSPFLVRTGLKLL